MNAQRRELLLGIAALAASGYVPPGFAQGAPSLSDARFGEVSRTLTGYAYSDAQLASSMLEALRGAMGTATLERIAAIATTTAPDRLSDALRAANLDKQAQELLVALASGVVETAKGPVVITYDDALAWQAVPWTKPNALCGGQTDYWADAPVEPK